MTAPRNLSSTVFLSCFLSIAQLASVSQAKGVSSPSNAERARATLRGGLDSGDYTVRVEAITAAGMIGRSEALLTRLEGFLQDKNVAVRLATIHTLADLNSPGCKSSLLKVLEEDNTPEVQFAAAKVLAEMDDPLGTTALMEVYEDKRKTRSNIIKEQERSFFDEFHSVPSTMMFVVDKGIGYVPVPGAGEGFAAIVSLLRDHGLSNRATALLILARTKNQQSLELLRGALRDHDWSVRATAAQMIAHTARTELRDSLSPLFEDKNEKVRFRAAGAYLHLLQVTKQATPSIAMAPKAKTRQDVR
jgi:HEAT repeat protein